jgi:hypothetical protein
MLMTSDCKRPTEPTSLEQVHACMRMMAC